MANLFTQTIFTEIILPWILVFVLFFAILEKTGLLGEGKKQINAIISAVIALLLLSFPQARDVVNDLIPLMVIAVVVIFVFLLLYSFVSGEKKGDPLNKATKITFGVIIGIFVITSTLVVTGTWDNLWDYLSSSNAGTNILFILLAAAAVIAVLMGKGKKGSSDE